MDHFPHGFYLGDTRSLPFSMKLSFVCSDRVEATREANHGCHTSSKLNYDQSPRCLLDYWGHRFFTSMSLTNNVFILQKIIQQYLICNFNRKSSGGVRILGITSHLQFTLSVHGQLGKPASLNA